jgi:hypothetical protein
LQEILGKHGKHNKKGQQKGQDQHGEMNRPTGRLLPWLNGTMACRLRGASKEKIK